MLFPMPKTAAQMIQNGTPEEYGKDARFFRINDVWGFKYYSYKRYAEGTYRYQQEAHKLHLAPAVGQFYSFPNPRYPANKIFGYLTQCVEMTVWEAIKRRGIGMWEAYDVFYKEYEKEHPVFQRIVRFFTERSFNGPDLHPYNVGLLHGELVCIDFSSLVW